MLLVWLVALLRGLSHLGLPCWLQVPTLAGIRVQHNFISSAGFGLSFSLCWKEMLLLSPGSVEGSVV